MPAAPPAAPVPVPVAPVPALPPAPVALPVPGVPLPPTPAGLAPAWPEFPWTLPMLPVHAVASASAQKTAASLPPMTHERGFFIFVLRDDLGARNDARVHCGPGSLLRPGGCSC